MTTVSIKAIKRMGRECIYFRFRSDTSSSHEPRASLIFIFFFCWSKKARVHAFCLRDCLQHRSRCTAARRGTAPSRRIMPLATDSAEDDDDWCLCLCTHLSTHGLRCVVAKSACVVPASGKKRKTLMIAWTDGKNNNMLNYHILNDVNRSWCALPP